MAELDVAPPPGQRFEMEPFAAVAPRETNGAIPSGLSPLRTHESFTDYCAQVQGRLRERAATRRQFLQAAYDRLTGLLHAALAVDDQPLYNELWQHRVAAKELLESALRATNSPALEERAGLNPYAVAAPSPSPPMPAAPVSSLPVSSAPAPAAPVSCAPPRPMPLEVKAPPLSSAPYESGSMPFPPAPPRPASIFTNGTGRQDAPEIHDGPEYSPSYSQDYNAPRLPRRPVRPLADIEADAVKMREELRVWAKTHPLQLASKELHIPNCLRLRSICCRQRRLEEEAGDNEVHAAIDLGEDIEKMLDDANDQEYTVALDYEIEPMPTAYQWGELSERYDEMALAFEAFIWWNQHWTELTVSEVQPLAEAVAAIQQRFNRLLFRIGARDPFQQMLFDDLRVWAREAQCYLHSLRPKVPIQELIERAGGLDEAWDQARIPVSALNQRQVSIDNVLKMVSESDFGQHGEADEEALRAALLRCREFKIPASERSLRDALLPWAAMLETDERFKDYVREIHLEWERRQEADRAEELVEEPHGALDELKAELNAVLGVTKGKRLLILGGTCREENRRKIEEALQLSELVWPSTKPSDPLAKFDTELRHSDIVALLTRFSRKEWKNAQDICAQTNKPFVHLTTGYGVAQVVRHFYKQIAPQGASHA